MDRGAWKAVVHGVAEGQTRLSNFTSLFTFMHWRRKWQPTPVFLPGEAQGQGSLVAAVYGVAQSRTRLKRLSGSSRVNQGGMLRSYGRYLQEIHLGTPRKRDHPGACLPLGERAEKSDC